jgi:hypothetical protein
MTDKDEELTEAFRTQTNGTLYANAVKGSRGAARELSNRMLGGDEDAQRWHMMYMVHPRD